MRIFLFLLAMALALGCRPSIAQSSTPGGTITNRGRSPDTAPKSALSSYQKQLRDLLGAQWNRRIHDANAKSEISSDQRVRIHFVLAPSGKVTTIKLLEGAGIPLADLSKQAVLACHFPPVPPELLSAAQEPYFEMDFDFVIY